MAEHKCKLAVGVAAIGLLLKPVADIHAPSEEAHTLRFHLKPVMVSSVWNDDIVANSHRRHGISNLGHVAGNLKAHVPSRCAAGDAAVCVQMRAVDGVI